MGIEKVKIIESDSLCVLEDEVNSFINNTIPRIDVKEVKLSHYEDQSNGYISHVMTILYSS